MRKFSYTGALLKGLCAGALALACVAMAPLSQDGPDKVTLKSGQVLEGTITREADGYVWIKVKYGSMEKELFYAPTDIASVERDAPTEPLNAAAPSNAPEAASSARRSGAPRLAVLTLGEPGKDMVGVYMVSQAIREAIPMLEAEQIDCVVLKINSGGGYLLEISRLTEIIHNELKPRFRTVAWIESAISAAAMTAHCVEDIYFMSNGHYGACTGFSGALVAVKDRPLEEVIYGMEKISAWGNKDPMIMRAMQIMEPLSASFDSNGEVIWSQDLTGEYIVNPEGRILTFNSAQAEQFKFSQGTADTIDELASLLGYQEVEWVGEKVAGVPYPICKAEKYTRAFRAKTHTDESNTNRYFTNYQTAVGMAQGAAEKEDRAKFVGVARQALDSLERMVRNNHNMALLRWGGMDQFKEWMEEQRELLRQLMR